MDLRRYGLCAAKALSNINVWEDLFIDSNLDYIFSDAEQEG